MDKDITLPRAWFERLKFYLDRVNSTEGDKNDQAVILLIGYCTSVETILELKK